MIVDLILDRKDNDNLLKMGYTHITNFDGTTQKIEYNAREFYYNVMKYINVCGGKYAERITEAMDYGTEQDVKDSLNQYIIDCGYNTEICNYIDSVQWLMEN